MNWRLELSRDTRLSAIITEYPADIIDYTFCFRNFDAEIDVEVVWSVGHCINGRALLEAATYLSGGAEQ